MRWYALQTCWIGILLFFAWLAVLVKILVIDTVRHNIRKRYMLNCGYQYRMKSNQGYKDREWWGYVKNGTEINENQIDSLTMNQVRKLYH